MSRKLFAKRTSAKHVRPDVPKQLVLPHRRIETENALTRQETTVVIVNTKEHISTAKGPYPKPAIQRQQSTALREPRVKLNGNYGTLKIRSMRRLEVW